MSDYPLKHDHIGSAVYKLEKYSFCFRGVPAAEIQIMDIIHPFLFTLKEMKDFGLTFHSIFKTIVRRCP